MLNFDILHCPCVLKSETWMQCYQNPNYMKIPIQRDEEMKSFWQKKKKDEEQLKEFIISKSHNFPVIIYSLSLKQLCHTFIHYGNLIG